MKQAINPAIDKVLEKCALVVVSTRMPSPLRDTDEGERSGSRVTKVLQSCFNPEALRPLSKLKSTATRACRAVGTRLETLQAWTVVHEELPALMAQLEKISQEWDTQTKILAASIGDQVDIWAAANPNEAEAIRRLAPSPEEVIRRSKFLRTSFRLKSEDVLDQEALEAEMDSLLGKVLYEMAQMLKDASLHKNTGKVYTAEAFEVLRRIGHKCRSMAFIDPLLDRIANALDDVQARFAGQARVTDLDALAMQALITQLLDTGRLLRAGLAIPQAVAGPAPVGQVAPVAAPVAAPAPSVAPRKPPRSAATGKSAGGKPVVAQGLTQDPSAEAAHVPSAAEASAAPLAAAQAQEQARRAQEALDSAVLI